MDERRFDGLTRIMDARLNRRGLGSGFIGVLAGCSVVGSGVSDAAAAKNNKKK